MASLSAPGIRNNIPMIHSKAPKQARNTSAGIKGIVTSSNASTKGLAGLMKNTFKIPNQKKTRNIANRATGTEIFRMK